MCRSIICVAATACLNGIAAAQPIPFESPVFLFPPHGVIAVESAHVDEDGLIDLVVASIGSNVSVFRGLGQGQFSSPLVHSIGTFHLDFVIADLNGDDLVDIATADFGGGSISVAFNHGNGGFDLPQTFPTPGVAMNRGMAAGDVDSDGDCDLVVGDAMVANKVAMLNDGQGQFQAQPLPGGSTTIAMALGDLDGDGDLDCLSGFAGVYVHLNNGNGTFAAAQPLGANLQTTALAIADLNDDSRLDVVVIFSSTSVNQALVFLNTGPGATFRMVSYTIDMLARDVAIADLDADGDLDVATSHVSHINRVNVLRNDGNGTLAPAGSTFPGDYPQSLTIGDFDGDGLNDIATANEFADPPSIGLLRNDSPIGVTGDVNHDGQVDIDDLVLVITSWGICSRPCPPACTADANANCSVDIDDLVLVITNWGSAQ